MTTNVYRKRTLEAALRRAADQFPVVVLTGARQCGKTTLVQNCFGQTHLFRSLDDPTTREQAIADPVLFLQRSPPPLILDEVQYAPEILSAVKIAVDADRRRMGAFVLTGSQVFPLMQGVTESLAGRAAVLSLHSFSLAEALGQPEPAARPIEILERRTATDRPATDRLAEAVLRGGYPRPALAPEADLTLWHGSYVQTYLERDVRSLRAVGDLRDFQRFLLALAARSGSLLNLTDVARDLGLTGKTARAWLSVLEASAQVVTLRPYHANLGKRLVKRPKAYFLDTGTLAYLLGVRDHDQVLTGLAAGPLFETAVLGQLWRLFAHRGEAPPISFFRTASGHEVDFLVDVGDRIIPIEAKLTATPQPAQAAGIEALQAILGPRAGHGLLVCLAAERHPLTRTVDALPLGAF